MILSCILLRKMDIVVVSGFGAAIGLGRLDETWALAKDAKTETNTIPTGSTTRAMDRNIKNPPRSPGAPGRALRFTDLFSPDSAPGAICLELCTRPAKTLQLQVADS